MDYEHETIEQLKERVKRLQLQAEASAELLLMAVDELQENTAELTGDYNSSTTTRIYSFLHTIKE